MYVSASIHVAFLSSRDASLAVPARANLIASLKLLKSMKVYWTNLERLVSVCLDGQSEFTTDPK